MTTEWTWLGRPLAVDLANTMLPGPSGAPPVELLREPADLDGWLAVQGDRLPRVERGGTSRRLADVRLLRDDVRALLSAAVNASRYPQDAVARVNATAAAAFTGTRLELQDGVPAVSEFTTADLPSTAALAEIARSAILELAGGRRELLRSCGAPGCGAYYVAGRARQQWCSDACGNRARVARHAARRRATPA